MNAPILLDEDDVFVEPYRSKRVKDVFHFLVYQQAEFKDMLKKHNLSLKDASIKAVYTCLQLQVAKAKLFVRIFQDIPDAFRIDLEYFINEALESVEFTEIVVYATTDSYIKRYLQDEVMALSDELEEILPTLALNQVNHLYVSDI